MNSLDGSQIKTIGSLTFTAFMFEAIGLSFGIIVRYCTPNPKRWFGGLLAAGVFSNTNDLPIAYVSTLAASPFFSSNAESQGIAYSVIFMVTLCVTLFNLGGFKLIAMDFRPANHDLEADSYTTPIVSVKNLKKITHYRRHKKSTKNIELGESGEADDAAGNRPPLNKTHSYDLKLKEKEKDQHDQFYKRQVQLKARNLSASGTVASTSRLGEPPMRKRSNSKDSFKGSAIVDTSSNPEAVDTETLEDIVKSFSRGSYNDNAIEEDEFPEITRSEEETSMERLESHQTSLSEKKPVSRTDRVSEWFGRHHMSYLFEFLLDFKRPQSLAMIISMTCAMEPTLRRLFVVTDSADYIPNAPDGRPCLDFIMNFASFIGAASVPLGLSMLGATIARLDIRNLPKGFWKSMVLMTLLKLVVLPIIAVAWTNKMRDMNWIDKDDKMAVFVIVVTAGVPTATAQLYITAMYTTPGADHLEMDCCAAYLITQYSVLLFSLTILVTYALKNMVGM